MSLNITSCSTACVNADKYLAYVPVASTATNLIDLFLKYAVAPCLNPDSLATSHYFTYLETKSLGRTLTLLIPVLGNILIGLYDLYADIKGGITERGIIPKIMTRAGQINEYRIAADRGHKESCYKLGCLLLGDPVFGDYLEPESSPAIPCPAEAKKYLRMAAALGHAEANARLGTL